MLVERTWERRRRRRRPVTHTGVTDPGVALPCPLPPPARPAAHRPPAGGGRRAAAAGPRAGPAPGAAPGDPAGGSRRPASPGGRSSSSSPARPRGGGTAPRAAARCGAWARRGPEEPGTARHGPQRPQRLAARSRGGGGARPSHSACKRQPSLHRGSAGNRGIPLESEGCLTHALHR